jgi:hypothetical protein
MNDTNKQNVESYTVHFTDEQAKLAHRIIYTHRNEILRAIGKFALDLEGNAAVLDDIEVLINKFEQLLYP